MTEPAMAPEGRMPEKFGRYVLTDRVGHGGMAEVFRAVMFGSEGFRRVIVVKRIRREFSQSPNFLKMFFDEAKISALLHHKNIVQVYDFGQVDGQYFLAMEYLEGRDVARVLRALRPERRAIPPSLAAHVGREVVLGLQYVHTLHNAADRPFDIVHRDVTPANVMLLRTGGIKLLDFGIAVASDLDGQSPPEREALKGKLSYLSPEQARCEPLDGRSDLFSWGATLWEMLTGIRLFGGRSDSERLTAVKQMPVPAPSVGRHEIPKALDRIIMRSLERDLSLRYQSAEELADDLATFLKLSPPPQDAVTQLLSDLFGNEGSAGSGVPFPEGSLATKEDPQPRLRAADRASSPDLSNASSEFTRPVDAAPQQQQPPGNVLAAPPRRAMLVAAGAALLVAGVVVISLSLRTPSPAPSDVSSATVKAKARSDTAQANISGALPPGHVRIEVDSEPSGARVSGSHGLLGTTPLLVTLPISAESEQLRFEKAGFEPTTYEVRPERMGMIFVELPPIRR